MQPTLELEALRLEIFAEIFAEIFSESFAEVFAEVFAEIFADAHMRETCAPSLRAPAATKTTSSFDPSYRGACKLRSWPRQDRGRAALYGVRWR